MSEERDYVKDKVIVVKSITIDTERNNPDVIAKIRFDTSVGDITHKPKIEKQIKRKGIPVNQVQQCTLDEIPAKVEEIYNRIQELGQVAVKASYSVWNTTDKENDPVTYRFVQYGAELDKWEIQEDGTEEVKVE